MLFKHLATCMLVTSIAFPIYGEELLISHASGEQEVIEITNEDSFLTVLDLIKEMNQPNEYIFAGCFDDKKVADQVHPSVYEDENLALEITFASNKVIVAKSSKKNAYRSYSAHLTQKERDDISYILKTLFNHTFITLAPYRSALKKAGERVDHVHPLRFLQCIFTDEELKVCVKNIQGKILVWGEFLNGITTSLREETKKGNVRPEHLADFAATLGIDVGAIYASYINQQWEEMVNILINVVPRQETAQDDRYNI